MNRSLFYTVIAFCLLSLAGCRSKQAGGMKTEMPEHYADSLITYLNRLSFTGKHDSVISIARPALYKALDSHDTLAAIYSGVFIAQSFLFLEDMDSVQYYTELISPMSGFPVSANLQTMLCNVLGSYSLRTSLDYSRALNYYMEGLAQAEKSGEVNNCIALLANIVNIFYIQEDTKGMQYAEEAYRLAMSEEKAGNYAKCAGNIVMAQMLFIDGRNEEAKHYLEGAMQYAEAGRAYSQYSYIYSLLAQIYLKGHDPVNAGIYYDRAVKYIKYTDPGAASQVYLTYGEFLADTGNLVLAAEMYRKGLDVSEKSGNMEYRQQLLGHMADLAYGAGDWEATARYSRMHRVYSDSISDRRKTEFNDLMLSKQNAENERNMLSKELDRQKAEQRFLKLLFISIAIVVFAVLLFVLYRRERKMYRELVKKHQEYIARLDMKEMKSKSDTAEGDNAERELFNRIEDLMRNARLYRSKTLTLETLAEKLGTNRTYCSRAINTFAGMSFNRYLDTFRIEEATRIISDSGKDILFKQLASDVGYNSVTVFSKAFQRETGCSPTIYRKEVQGYKHKLQSDNS